MCGFVGVISKNNKKFPEKTLRAMTGMIQHRGPDDEGFIFDGEWLAMGFKRLSILDLSPKGHQPMTFRDELAMVYNGEIYNFREIREELKKDGFEFKSDSDTEVVLASYARWGRKCVEKFTGMFAFVIADLKNKKAFIARDQLGIKPLFLYEDSDNYIFSSEIKCLLPYKTLEPDMESFSEYLVFRSLAGQNTMFRGVKSLLQGHFMKYETGELKTERYFNLKDTLAPERDMTFGEACGKTEECIQRSIEMHLRSDVELGVQLSGGVDSSLITAVSSELTGKKLHSFSVSFDESVFDESEYQQRISRKYNTEHHDYRMTEDIFTKLLFESTWHYEHPLNDPNTVATYFLTKQAREYITVMLAGEGADEAFMGYSRFKPDVLSRLKNRNFFFRYPLVRETLRKLWPLKKGSKIFDITKYAPSMYALSYADTNFTHALLKGNDSAFRFRREVNNSGEGDVLAETILQYQLCDLTQWFWRADRMGMAASMELRVPFCAVPVFSLANSIPYSLHMSGGECKAVLKKVAEKYLGHDQIYRKKIGFGVPISEWIKKDGPYGKLFRELTQSPEFRNRPGIDIKHFDMIYKSFTAGSYKELNCAFLWTYFCFEIWYRTFFEEGWKKYRDIN